MNRNIVQTRALCRMIAAAVLAIGGPASVCAAGDASIGKQLYEQKCTGCHAVDANRIGPAHRGVFGRKAGSVSGYSYSSALRGSQVVWTENTLNAWLANPEQVIPGQAMYFKIDDEETRKSIIAYLATLH